MLILVSEALSDGWHSPPNYPKVWITWRRIKLETVDFRQWLVFFLNNVHRYDDDLKMDLAELLPHAFRNSNDKSE
jgi:hypothetical protein